MSQDVAISRKKFIIFLVIFVGIVLFQLTELRYIWGVTGIGRLYNVFFLLILSTYIVLNISTKKLSNNVWIYYILPGLLVFIGYFVNITNNTLREPFLATNYGSLIPWAVYLSTPFLLKDNIINTKNLLRYYYFSTLLIVTLGLADYLLYFSGFVNLQVLNHPNGVFLSGWFSILHMLEDGSGHFRFYASIGEPGNLAMILIPSVIYSILYKRYLGMFVLTLGIYLTDSLGGFISVGLVAFLLPILLYRKYKLSIFVPILSSVLILSTVVINLNKMYDLYESKGESKNVRIDNVVKATENLLSIIVNNPTGVEFSINFSENTGENYYGSNFMPLLALYKGGLLAGIGYMIVIIVFFLTSVSYFYRKNISREDIICSLSIIALLSFIVQRSALLETSLLVLIFTPFVISNFSFYNKKT